MAARLGFGFLSHAGPGVGVDHVASGYIGGVVGEAEIGACERGIGAGGLHVVGGYGVALGADERDVHADAGRGDHQGGGHVVAVAHLGQVDALDAPFLLPDGEQVGQRLAGVFAVGQAVDHRHARVLGQVSTSLWANTRAMMPSTMRPSTRATSATLSRLPRAMWSGPR